jgi:hypothetical protein
VTIATRTSDLTPTERKEFSERALQQAREVARLYPRGDEFPVKSTRRQFERYVDWWGTPRFEDELVGRGFPRRSPWDGEFGLVQTAKRLVMTLRQKGAGPSGQGEPAAPPISAGPSDKAESTARPPTAGVPSDGETGLTKSSALAASATTKPATQSPAAHGDALWIEYGDGQLTHRWLIRTARPSRALSNMVGLVPLST